MTVPRIEALKLECLIGDIEGDILLLDLAIEDLLRQKVEGHCPAPGKGYTLLLLTTEQVTALTHASASAYGSAQALVQAFHGRPAP